MNSESADRKPFDEFLGGLEPGSSDTDARYRRLRIRLIKFFDWRGCEDPAELADETIMRLVDRLRRGEEIRTISAYSYVYGIAGFVFKEYLRQNQKRVVEHDPPPAPFINPDRFLECSRHCFERLNAADRELLERYYSDNLKPEELARERSLTLTALRVRIHRAKSQLRKCYLECLEGKDVSEMQKKQST